MKFDVHPDADALVLAARPLIGDDLLRMTSVEAFAAALPAAGGARVARMATWQSGGRSGVILQRDGLPVMLGDCPDGVARRSAAWLRVVAAGEAARPQGMLGSEAACAAFARAWFTRHAGTHRIRMRMRNHRLTRLIEPAPIAGTVRTATAADEPWLQRMQQAFVEEAGLPDSPASAAAMIAQRLASAGIRVWNDGTDVGFIGFVKPGARAARIAPVYTLPAFRRRGYAAALVASVVRDCLAEGRVVFLVTDLANPVPNRLYASVGFEPLDTQVLCDLVPA